MIEFWESTYISDVLLSAYVITLGLAWLLMIFNIENWGKAWRVSRPPRIPEKGEFLSICVPARNEAENIGACVRHALQSRWPNLEVLVVDDRSTDDTGAIALEAAAGDNRFRLIKGEEPQVGWAGKPWTCARAAKEAKGAWLLFIDADVCVDKDAAAAAVLLAQERELDLLSFFGRWTLVSFWEKTIIPAVGWLIRGVVDFDKANNQALPDAFANGQFILMRRSAYASIDGHGAVRDQVLEDVRLAQAVKRAGFRVEIRPAGWSFDVRLYRSLQEIVQGYAKNLYEGMNRNPMMGFSAILFILFGSLFPFFALIFAILMKVTLGWNLFSWSILAGFLLISIAQLVFRWRIERFDERAGNMSWSHPLANVMLIYILLRSTLGIQVQWTGRVFIDGRAKTK
ncbi:MAG: glycosyltransferase family 2 protein [Myxococcota bacterium]|nr:glycosyltransferase family 2 protein [Myxococcota bacterium]